MERYLTLQPLCSQLLTICTYAHAEEIKIGIIDSFNPGLFSETLSPTLDYLNQKLPQHQFKFVPVNSINPAEDLKRQDVSFFICSAGTFHELSLLQGCDAHRDPKDRPL